jgi:hypothetical protein
MRGFSGIKKEISVMNTNLSKKAAAWSLYQVLGLVMILSMVFAAPLAVLGESIDWTEPVPPDAPPGSTITIKGGTSDGAGYLLGETVHVEVVGPNGLASFAGGINWCDALVVEDPESEYLIWACEIVLADSPDAVGDYTYTATGLTSGVVENGAFKDAFPVSPGSIMLDPGDSVTFVASGGTEPYSYGFFQNQSNATIDPTTGVYVAGFDGIAGTDVVDIIEVTDAKNNKSYAYVFVGEFGFGQTINDVPCAVELSGFNDLNCTAQDVRIASVTSIEVLDDGCAYPGDTVKFRANYEVFTGATERYDIGLFFATDGDPDNSGAYTGTCSIATLPYGPPEFFNDLDGVQGGVQDTCGDVSTNLVNPVYHNITLTVVCVANPTTGNLELPYLVSWAQGGRDLCTSPLEALPGTKAKCSANNEYSIDIPVPGQIIVDKNTGGIESPDFGFTVSEYVEDAWVERAAFLLAGQDEPWKSSDFYAGLYKVEESTIPLGWTPSDTAYKCVSDMYPTAIIDPIHIDLNPGETITCTFYNEQNTGTIVIEKETIFGDGTFDFTSDELGPFSIITTGGSGSKTFEDQITGTYSVFETVPAGWTLINATCEDDEGTELDPDEFILEPDATVTCTFVNKKQLADLTVTKTAVPTFTRTWDWDITKTATAPTTRYGTPGSLVEFGYSVGVVANKTDSAWAISGVITVTNPNAVAFELDSLTDMAGTTPCSLNPVGPYTVPASSSLQVGYTCPTFASGASGTNTAEATWNKDFYNTPTGKASGSAGYAFTNPTTETDECIDVSDTAKGALGMVCAVDAPKTFTYNQSWTAVAGVCTDYPNTASFETNDTAATDSDDAKVTVCAGQDLTVSKTVDEAGYTKTWTWEIDKEYDGTYHLFAGESVDHDYLVSLTPTDTDSAWYVEGTITVTNPIAWTAVTLTSLLDTIPGGVCVLVDPPATLAVPAKVGTTPGTLTVDYRCTFAAKPAYTGLTNTATATWSAATYFTPTGTASGTAPVTFKMAEEIGDIIYVSDTNWAAGVTEKVDANNKATWEIDYFLPFDCSEKPGDYKDGYYTYDKINTAAIVGTTPLISDTAKVTVNCYNPTVSKTADGTYDRTYKWAIDKSVDPTKINVLIGMEGTFNYTVKISSAGYTDDNFTVAGKITVVNPHPTEDIKVLVTDEIGTVACKVSGLDKDGYVLVKAKTSAILDYTCEDLTGKETQNDVEAAWTAYAGTDGEVTGTATASKAITFNKDGEYLDTVTIYDDKTDPLKPVLLGTVSIKDTLPKSFTYMLKFVAVEGCMSYTNKAWIKETEQYDTATATICGVYWAWTPGFWRNHGPGAPHGKDAWQYTAYETTDLLGSVFTLGEFTSLRIKGSTATFGSITLLDAVRLKGGTGDSGAAEILLRAGTASLLNASLHERLVAPNHPAAVAVDHDKDPKTPDVLMSCDPALPTCTNPVIYFPLTSQGVKTLVNAALLEADRSKMLALAAQLDYYNNGWEYFDWTWPVP